MPPSRPRLRLDRLLVERGLEDSRERARARILAGEVRVNGQPVTKAGTPVRDDATVELVGQRLPYVSRGGLKLEQALRTFDVPVDGAVCLDIGASTGGFTDCVLQHGAARVYAVDVGYGQLAWSLRQDDRVIVIERTNIRRMPADAIPEPVDLVVVDCSFIAAVKVIAPALVWMRSDAHLVALIKPQFEAGRDGVGKGGIVRDPGIREGAIRESVESIAALGFTIVDGTDCDTHGPGGNVEYLLHAQRSRAA